MIFTLSCEYHIALFTPLPLCPPASAPMQGLRSGHVILAGELGVKELVVRVSSGWGEVDLKASHP